MTRQYQRKREKGRATERKIGVGEMHSPEPDGEWREKRREKDLYIFFPLTPSFPSLVTWGYKKLKPQLPALPSSLFEMRNEN